MENDSVSHFSSQRMYSPGPTLRKYPAGTKETGMDPVVGEEPLFSKHFIRLLYLTHGLMDGICYTPISQGGRELAVVWHTTSDLGAPHPHPIIQPLPGGSGACRALPSSS